MDVCTLAHPSLPGPQSGCRGAQAASPRAFKREMLRAQVWLLPCPTRAAKWTRQPGPWTSCRKTVLASGRWTSPDGFQPSFPLSCLLRSWRAGVERMPVTGGEGSLYPEISQVRRQRFLWQGLVSGLLGLVRSTTLGEDTAGLRWLQFMFRTQPSLLCRACFRPGGRGRPSRVSPESGRSWRRR